MIMVPDENLLLSCHPINSPSKKMFVFLITCYAKFINIISAACYSEDQQRIGEMNRRKFMCMCSDLVLSIVLPKKGQRHNI